MSLLTWRKQAPALPIMISDLWGKRDEDGGFGEHLCKSMWRRFSER